MPRDWLRRFPLGTPSSPCVPSYPICITWTYLGGKDQPSPVLFTSRSRSQERVWHSEHSRTIWWVKEWTELLLYPVLSPLLDFIDFLKKEIGHHNHHHFHKRNLGTKIKHKDMIYYKEQSFKLDTLIFMKNFLCCPYFSHFMLDWEKTLHRPFCGSWTGIHLF